LTITTTRMKIVFKIIFLVGSLFSYGSGQTQLTTEKDDSMEALEPTQLITVNDEVDEKDPACCSGDGILTCEQITVNAKALGEDKLELTPLGLTVEFNGMVDGNNDTYNYTNSDTTALLTYNATSGGMSGQISVEGSEVSYIIEFCGQGITVLKSMGQNDDFDDFVQGSDDSTETVAHGRSLSCSTKGYRYFRYTHLGKLPKWVCMGRCLTDKTKTCVGWTGVNRGSCYIIQARTVYNRYYSSGPKLSPECNLDKSVCYNANTLLQVRYLTYKSAPIANACHYICKNYYNCSQWRWNSLIKRCYLYRAYYSPRKGWTSGPRFSGNYGYCF